MTGKEKITENCLNLVDYVSNKGEENTYIHIYIKV